MEEGSSPSECLSPGGQDTESRCPICLSTLTQCAFTDPCFHSFCFPCILQWSEVSSSCPMCKTSFTKIVYDVKANDLYQVHEVRPTSKPTASGGWGGEAGPSSGDTRRFWYRSSLVPGQPAHRRRVHQSRAAATEERRRVVYSLGLRVKPLPAERGRVRVRDISARFFHNNPASIHRLIPWLVREFKVLVGRDHTDFMVQLIVSLVNSVDLEGGSFAQHLRPFLHEKTDHFMHELISFAKSPFDMIAFDERSSYDFVPPNHHQDQPGPSRSLAIQTVDRLWPDTTPYGVAAQRDNTLVGESWESPPLHPERGGPSTEDTPTPIVIDLTTPESSHAHQPTPPAGHTTQELEGEGSTQQEQYNSGHSQHDQPLHRHSHSPSHHSKHRSHSHRSHSHRSPSHRSPSHHSKHRSRSPLHRSHSHRSRSPSHRSCSPSHRSRSPSHRSRSPSHRTHSHRSSPHRTHSHRSPSHRSKHRHRSSYSSGSSTSRGKERARDHRSHSHAHPRQDSSVSSTSGLQEELCCVKEEIQDSRARLLQGLLQEEKTAFLQARLQEERNWPVPRQRGGAAGQGGSRS